MAVKRESIVRQFSGDAVEKLPLFMMRGGGKCDMVAE